MIEDELNSTFSVFVAGNSIIHVDFFSSPPKGEENEARAILVEKAVKDVLNKDNNKAYKMRVNILPMGKTHITNEANQIYRRIAKEGQITKIAVIGQARFQTTVLNYILPFMKMIKNKVKWFSDEHEADEWLSSDKF
tara:strand:- start:533 stop:943 length:411 start_codon:yes stop_codon:yes gene_type:complete